MFYALKNGGTYLPFSVFGPVADGTRVDGRAGGRLRAVLEQMLERFGPNRLGDAPGRFHTSEHRTN